MATDPFRLRVQKALSAIIESVTPGNGYNHDLTGAVFRGRVMFGESDPLPMCSILEQPLPLEQLPGPLDSEFLAGPWPLVIQGFVEDDEKNPTDPAHHLMADVKKALAAEKAKANDGRIFGMKEVTNLEIGPGTVRPPDEVSSKAYFWLALIVHMAEDLRDPYA